MDHYKLKKINYINILTIKYYNLNFKKNNMIKNLNTNSNTQKTNSLKIHSLLSKNINQQVSINYQFQLN